MTRHRARPSFTVEIKRSRTSPLPDGERPQSERPASKPAMGVPKAAAGTTKPPAGLTKPPVGAFRPPAGLPASDEPERQPSSPGRSLWAGTGLLEEAAAATQSGRFDPPDFAVFAKSPADKSPADKAQGLKEAFPKAPADLSPRAAAPAKRVLPSLIAPPEPEPEPEVAPEPEARLPRVRRARAAEPAAPRRAAGPRPAFVWPEDWPDEAPIQTPAPIALPAAKAPAPAPKPVAEAADASESGDIRLRGKRRTGDEDLRIGQRWKRRLPRVCW